MKRFSICLSVSLAAVLLMAGCGGEKTVSPTTSSKPASTAATASPSPSAAKTEAPSPSASATASPAPTKDVRDTNAAQREEISNLIKDAEELINEGLTDDANMILRDLRSRNLTEQEKKKVDDLQGRLVKISD